MRGRVIGGVIQVIMIRSFANSIYDHADRRHISQVIYIYIYDQQFHFMSIF
jgi:hypothetical protein